MTRQWILFFQLRSSVLIKFSGRCLQIDSNYYGYVCGVWYLIAVETATQYLRGEGKWLISWVEGRDNEAEEEMRQGRQNLSKSAFGVLGLLFLIRGRQLQDSTYKTVLCLDDKQLQEQGNPLFSERKRLNNTWALLHFIQGLPYDIKAYRSIYNERSRTEYQEYDRLFRQKARGLLQVASSCWYDRQAILRSVPFSASET